MRPLPRILPRRPVKGQAPGRSPGSRIDLLPAPSRPRRPVALAGFVPDHSDGVAAASTAFPGPSWASRARITPGTLTEPPLDRNTAAARAAAVNTWAAARNLTLGGPGGEIGQPR